MKIGSIFHALLIISVALVCSRDAAAQIRRYQPKNPTLSPYLNLLRPEGALPNYYALVRPLEQQRQFQQNVGDFERRQVLVNRELEQQFGQPQGIIPTGTAGRFMSEGANGAYLNSRRYFNQFQSGSLKKRQR